MFEPVCVSEVIRAPCGTKILNGTRCADISKRVEGVERRSLRFMSNLPALNGSHRKLRGNSGKFPQAPRLSGLRPLTTDHHEIHGAPLDDAS